MHDTSPEVADSDLLRRSAAGDPAALEAVLGRYWAAVVCYAASLLGDSDQAEDAAQECFVRFWERRETWRIEGSLRGLLFQIVRNLALDERRRVAARARAADRADEARPPRTPEQETEAAELRELISRALGALPKRRREVFVLVRVHGLSHREVAELLDIAPQTVANHLGMALAELRDALHGRASWTN